MSAVNQTTSVHSATSLLNQFKLSSHVCYMFRPLLYHLQLRQPKNIYRKISYLLVYVLVSTSIVPFRISSLVNIYCTFLYMILCWHLLYLPVYVLVSSCIVPSCICSCVDIYFTFLYMFLCWHLLYLPVYVLVLTSIVPSSICSCVMYCIFLYMFLCWHARRWPNYRPKHVVYLYMWGQFELIK